MPKKRRMEVGSNLTRFKRFTLETFAVSMVVMMIDMIILAPVLPLVMGEFHLPLHWAVWILSLPLAVFSFALPVMENGALIMGRIKILIVSLIVLSLGTLIVFFAKPWVWLMWGRVVQAIGLAGAVPYIAMQIRRIWTRQNRRKQLGAFLLCGLVGAILPCLSAGLTLLFGWKGAFLVHGLLVILLFLASRKWLWSDRPARVGVASGMSILFFGLILLFIMAGLSNTDLLGGWQALLQPDVLPFWIMGIGMVIPLLMVERQQNHPFFEPHLFANWRFWLLYGQVALSGFLWMGLLLIPSWIADRYGFAFIPSAALFSLLLLCSLFALLFVGKAARVWGFCPTSVVGYALSALAFVALASGMPPSWTFIALGLYSFGSSFVLFAPVHQPLFVWIPNRRMRSGMMTLSMFRAAGGAIGLLAIARLFTSVNEEMPLSPNIGDEALANVYAFLALVSLAGLVLTLFVRFQRSSSRTSRDVL